MKKTKKIDDEMIIDIDNYELSEEDKQLFEATNKKDKQLKRWFLTINNPFWTEEDKEVDINNTDYEIKEDFYNLDYLKSFNNIDLFEFHFVEVTASVDEKRTEKGLKEVEDEETKEKKLIEIDIEKTVKVTKTFIIERPYFKSYEHFKNYLDNLQVEGLKYAVGQVEKRKTVHLQFGVNFDDTHGKRFYTMKKYFPTAYLAQARGSNYDIKVYCTKLDTRIEEPFEIGKFVEMRKRTDYDEFYSALKSGASDLELFDNFYQIASTKGIDKIKQERDIFFNSKYKECGRNLVTTYIYGEPGTGKTKSVYKRYGFKNVFRVSKYGKFQFNGYDSEKVLLFDEFAGQIDLSWLNQILDMYPLRLEVKGSERIACYDKVFICSNFSFYEVYKNYVGEENNLFDSVFRRVHFIYRVDKTGRFIKEKDSIFEDIPEEEIELEGCTKRVSKSFIYDQFGVPKCVYDFHSKREQIQFKEVEGLDLIFD